MPDKACYQPVLFQSPYRVRGAAEAHPSLRKLHHRPDRLLPRRHVGGRRFACRPERLHVCVHRAEVAFAGGAQGESRHRRAGFGGLCVLDPLVARHAGKQQAQVGGVGGAPRAFVAERVAREPRGRGYVAACLRVAGRRA